LRLAFVWGGGMEKLKNWLDSALTMSAYGRVCLFSIGLQTGERRIGQVSLVQRPGFLHELSCPLYERVDVHIRVAQGVMVMPYPTCNIRPV
jgi:hypothetical protein